MKLLLQTTMAASHSVGKVRNTCNAWEHHIKILLTKIIVERDFPAIRLNSGFIRFRSTSLRETSTLIRVPSSVPAPWNNRYRSLWWCSRDKLCKLVQGRRNQLSNTTWHLFCGTSTYFSGGPTLTPLPEATANTTSPPWRCAQVLNKSNAKANMLQRWELVLNTDCPSAESPRQCLASTNIV